MTPDEKLEISEMTIRQLLAKMNELRTSTMTAEFVLPESDREGVLIVALGEKAEEVKTVLRLGTMLRLAGGGGNE